MLDYFIKQGQTIHSTNGKITESVVTSTYLSLNPPKKNIWVKPKIGVTLHKISVPRT